MAGCPSSRPDGEQETVEVSPVVTASPRGIPSPPTSLEPIKRIEPGPLLGQDGKPLELSSDHVEVFSVGVVGGGLAIGLRPELCPGLLKQLHSAPGIWRDATFEVLDENWAKLTPSSQPSAGQDLLGKVVTVQPAAGLAFANEKGECLMSLTASSPPAGFELVGQVDVTTDVIEKHKGLKGTKVTDVFFGLPQ